MNKKILIAILAASLTAGCSSTDSPNQVGGKIIGATTGALIGTQIGKGHGRLAAVGLGALLGAQLGGMVGERMDARDRQLADRTVQRTLESAPDHRAVGWKNPNNNHRGSFVATNTMEDYSSNSVCRDFVHTVTIDGQQEKVRGRACRDMRDTRGQWFIQE